ncbi:alpha/beta hydrolase [Streptosporangium sp. NPDC051023]|uniref:alpha/beta fold hydrolase n=1 Tax=Streptosporangium sp. NPDC051023 TaxID=3155410 RepID=UPI0034505720
MDVRAIEKWDIHYRDNPVLRTPHGIELYYELQGEGPPLTIVSNFFLASVAWRNFTKRLVTSHRLLTYDLRNQGASSDGDGSFANHVEDLAALLDGLGIEQTWLLGTSSSTQLTRDFAIAHPERVRGLVFCGPTVHPSGGKRRKYLLRAWLDDLERGGLRALFDNFYPLVFADRTIEHGGTPSYLALRERFLAVNSTRQLERNMRGALESVDSTDKLRRLTCPVLLLSGDADYLVSAAALAEAHELIPDATVEIIPDCGHSPYAETTDLFEAAVERFVARHER